MYLVAIKHNQKKAHYWIDNDTLCRLYSTGGLIKSRYHLVNILEHREICHMCSLIKSKN